MVATPRSPRLPHRADWQRVPAGAPRRPGHAPSFESGASRRGAVARQHLLGAWVQPWISRRPRRCTLQPRRVPASLPVSGGTPTRRGGTGAGDAARGGSSETMTRILPAGPGWDKGEHSHEQHHHRAAAAGHGRGRPDPVHRSPQRPSRPPARSAPGGDGGDGGDGQGCCCTRPPATAGPWPPTSMPPMPSPSLCPRACWGEPRTLRCGPRCAGGCRSSSRSVGISPRSPTAGLWGCLVVIDCGSLPSPVPPPPRRWPTWGSLQQRRSGRRVRVMAYPRRRRRTPHRRRLRW